MYKVRNTLTKFCCESTSYNEINLLVPKKTSYSFCHDLPLITRLIKILYHCRVGTLSIDRSNYVQLISQILTSQKKRLVQIYLTLIFLNSISPWNEESINVLLHYIAPQYTDPIIMYRISYEMCLTFQFGHTVSSFSVQWDTPLSGLSNEQIVERYNNYIRDLLN